jgi:hypothetical protein
LRIATADLTEITCGTFVSVVSARVGNFHHPEEILAEDTQRDGP